MSTGVSEHLQAEAWFDDVPRCLTHASGPATACGRCGRFCCARCADTRNPGLCEVCALIGTRSLLPRLARSVAWKLALAPLFMFVSAGVVITRHQVPPTSLAIWGVPGLCAAMLLVRPASVAAWLGTLTSVAILGWQALGLASGAEWDRLIDVAVLSIAPVWAIAGTVRLSRLHAHVGLADAASTTA